MQVLVSGNKCMTVLKIPVYYVQCHALDQNWKFVRSRLFYQLCLILSLFFFKLCVGLKGTDAMNLVCLMHRHFTALISGVWSVNACQHFRSWWCMRGTSPCGTILKMTCFFPSIAISAASAVVANSTGVNSEDC